MPHTEIKIDAPPAVVREALLNFSAIPSYHTSFLKQIAPIPADKATPPQPGDKLTVTAGNFTFSPVVEVNSETEFSWRGTLLSKMFFTGAHKFQFLADEGSSEKTRFVQSEKFEGAMAPLFGLMDGKKAEAGFKQFNEDFKKYVESGKSKQ